MTVRVMGGDHSALPAVIGHIGIIAFTCFGVVICALEFFGHIKDCLRHIVFGSAACDRIPACAEKALITGMGNGPRRKRQR